jgi:acetyltransferase-like isoleucine patch superfamily enzyme
MNRLIPALLLGLTLATVAHAHRDGNDDLDIDKVNGSIHVPDNATAGKLSTVNGGIRVGANAHAKSAETVNGGIDVESGSTIDSLETVNGGVHLGENVKVSGTVEAVNGSITLAQGADVTGHASNVNGGIKLDGAHVGGGLETVSGDITIGANSRVEGGVLVNEDHSWFRMGSSRKPRIVIGPHATVQGKLAFKRDVDLYVSDSATIGPVEGATPTKFSGDQAPK